MRKPSKKPSAVELKITKLENAIYDHKVRLAKLRRKVAAESVEDYVFTGKQGKAVRLSQLFGKNRELIVIHNMGAGCPYCTLWADGFNGVLHHLESRAAFVVESPDPQASQAKFAKKRGWKFRMVSSRGSGFRRDLGYATDDGYAIPGVSVFIKGAKGRIKRVSHAQFGPGDNYCIAWDLFDLLPKGSKGWEPSFKI